MPVGVLIFYSIILLLIVGLVLLIIYLQTQKKMKQNQQSSAKLKKHRGKRSLIPTAAWIRCYAFFDRNFFTRQSVRKLNGRFMELGIFDNVDSRVQATKIFLASLGMVVGLFLFGTFAFHDLFMGFVLLTAGVVLKDNIFKKNFDKYYFKMLEQLGMAISELRQAFLRLGSVADALSEITVGPLLVRQFAAIQDILVSADAEHKLEEFYTTAPLKVLQTLAGVCYTVDNGGDSILRDGSSNFINSLMYITSEINMEIEKLQYQKAKFQYLEFLPLFPVFMLAPISSFIGNTITGTQIVYNGTYGYLCRLIIIITALVCYMLISRVNSVVAIQFDDRPPSLTKMLHERKWRKFVQIILPRKRAILTKKLKAIKSSLSRLTLEYLYLKKAAFAAFGFLTSLVLLLFSIYTGLFFQINNVVRMSMTSGREYSEEQKQQLRELDNLYLQSTNMDEEEMYEEIRRILKPTTSLEKDITNELERMKEKKAKVEASGFKFYHLWLSLLIGAICWNIPEMQLSFRRWLIKTESEEDCLQLQTIISVLMNTSMDTLTLLDWLAKHSRVHQHILIDALHEYPSDPDLALGRLKNSAALPEFKRIVDKLMDTIHQVSLSEAFADLAQEREHIMQTRRVSQTSLVEKKRSRMSFVSLGPMILFLLLYFIGPIGIVAATEFTKIFENMPL